MTDAERLDWIMKKIDLISSVASRNVLMSLAIGDRWRVKPFAPNDAKMRAQWRVEIDEAMDGEPL